MEWAESIKYILAAVTGGGLASFLTFKIALKRQNLSEFEVLVNTYKELSVDLKTRVKDLEKELISLKSDRDVNRDELVHLRNQLLIFESSHMSIPLPMWMKDTKFKMVSLNKQYEEDFLKPLGFTITDYLGYDDEKIWGKELADEFRKLDAEVMRTKRPIERIEPLLDSSGNTYYAEVLKYPRFSENRVVGISGIIKNVANTKEQLERCQDEKK